MDIVAGSTVYMGSVGELLPELTKKRRVLVITDSNIDRCHAALIASYEHIVIGLGEQAKGFATLEKVYTWLMDKGADRSVFLLGIGGGIVTDVAGFVAATYMRGVEFGFVSTTLLGQVDASVGGKNGVNVADYKNMVGTFRQPRFVIADVEMLRTLPMRELRAGMAEVVKSAVIGDADLFDFVESRADDIFDDVEALQHAMLGAVAVKARIVAEDEREGGVRRLLNLGHTLGHAIEKCTHEVNHGEAVAMGMGYIARVAFSRGMLCGEDGLRIVGLLDKLGFELMPPVDMAQVLDAVKLDKKRENDMIRVVLPVKIGDCVVAEMSFEEFKEICML